MTYEILFIFVSYSYVHWQNLMAEKESGRFQDRTHNLPDSTE